MTLTEQALLRHHSIEGTFNVRDIGGYPADNGHTTRWGLLFRSDKLDRLTQEGAEGLRNLHIRTIIDLRYTPEVEVNPDVIAGVMEFGYRHLPLYELSGENQLPSLPDSAIDLYVGVLDNRQGQIKTIFDHLTSPASYPVLIHCTAGKDRTGLIIALVLGALGVPHETIIADYALSAVYIGTLLDELRLLARESGWDIEWYERLLSCDPSNMRQTLLHLDRVYGGVQAYLLSADVTMKQIETLRCCLLA
jgi:protein-tyrosine phosphatase